MTQDERRLNNYQEVMKFLQDNKRNLSKYDLEQRRLYTWLKHNRKEMNGGGMKPDRVELLKKLLGLCEQYRRKNQYE